MHEVRRLPACLLVLALAGCDAAGGGAGAGPRGARLVDVVDGDTVKVAVGGRRETVRLIGIDTPESRRPGTPVECGAHAATRALARLVAGDRRVRLVADPTQDRRDRYDRLLAYVELRDGRDLGEELARAGWAAPYVYDDPFRRLARYRAAAREARAQRRGIWGACEGDVHRPAGGG